MENKNKILPAQLFSQISQICLGVMVISLFIGGCTGLSKLSEGQYLVAEYQIDLEEKDEIYHYKETKNQLRDEITKDPNYKFLWMRPRLALHNTIVEPNKEKGLKYWLKYKLGKAPVLLDESYCQNLNVTFENRLYHKGHFNAISTFHIERKNKTAVVKYQIDAQQAYRIDTLILPDTDDTLSSAMHALQQNSLIIKDEIYQLQSLKKERLRIDNELKNMGFYYFNPDYIGFLADTTDGNHKVKLKLELKKDTPKDGMKVFSIGEISVAEDFRLENYDPDTSQVQNYKLISSSHYMKPKYFLNSILYDSGSFYSKQTHNNSIKQLMGLRSYKYVNARYSPSPIFDNKLDVTYMMTPSPKMSLSTELNAVTKSNSFAGPGLKLTYNSKNFFRGAELFSINFTGRFEKQVSKEQSDTAYEFSIDANLDFPRIIPFRIKKKDHPFLPNSNIVLGAGVFSRLSLYRFNSFTTGLGYSWRKNEYLTHAFKPIDVSVTDLVETTQDFEDFLEQNPSIRQSFEEQFIVGSVYNITLNKLGEGNLRRFYISFGVDPSGNLLSALVSLFGNSENDTKATAKIFGQQISQYSRGRLDLRYYFNMGKEAYLATKFYSGVGVPYGQSEVMPYVKQFYAGGTNSLRAFRARSLGPGSYIPVSDSLENVLVDQTGDIKLEANIEYRFPIMGFLKGAVFSDIGNIWLVNEDPQRPGGKFYLKTFHKQLAVGLGFGLRIDVNLMVLRFDWAFPVRKPWLPEGDRWAFDEIDILNSGWRKENLLWNISIGYPF